MAQLVAQLQTLPPEVNKYEAAAGLVEKIIAPATSPPWLHRTTIALAVIFGLQTLVSIATVTLLVKVTDGKFWLFRSGRDGIWIPNAQVGWGLFSGIFCAVNTANLIWQALIDDGVLTFRHKIVNEASRWFFMVCSDALFCHALVTRRFQDVQQERQLHSAPARTRFQPRTLATIINWSALALVIIFAASIAVVVALTDIALGHAIDATMFAVEGLLKAAPSYNPATFQMTDLEPLLEPVAAIIPPAEQFNTRVRATWLVYTFWIVGLTVVFLPYLVFHLRSLIRLAGASSIWAAMGFGCCVRPRSRSVTASHEMSGSSDRAPGTPYSPSVDKVMASPFREQPPTPGAAAVMNARAIGESRKGNAAKQASTLIYASILVYAVTAVYCGLAIWAASTTFQDQVFWNGQFLYGSGTYACLGLLVHFVIIWRCLITLRERRKQVFYRSGESSGSNGRRRFPKHNHLTLTTATIDDGYRGPGVWIETLTEVQSEKVRKVDLLQDGGARRKLDDIETGGSLDDEVFELRAPPPRDPKKETSHAL